LARARELHQQGQLEQANALYGQILAVDPDNAEAHYRRANVLKDQGALQAAVASYDRAIALKPDYAYAFCNRAVVLGHLQRLPEAVTSYERAIAIDPTDPIAHGNLGMLLNAMGAKDAALASFERAIACNAGFRAAHFGRAALLQERQQWAAALASYDAALALEANDPAAHYNRGIVLKQLERWPEALAGYERAIALNAGFVRAHVGRAEVLERLQRLPEALVGYENALRADPNDAAALNGRGVLLHKMGRLEAARASYEQALAVSPDDALVHYNYGTVLAELYDPRGALVSHERALALNPEFADAYVNRAVALEALGSVPEAIASLRQGIALKPYLPEGYFNLALMLLKGGDLPAGFAAYEWRWQAKSGPIYREKREFREPLWLGKEDIAGRTILLYGEQGLGDSLLFCRYCEQVAGLGAKVILEVPRPLVALCRTLKGVAQVVAYGGSLPPFDVQCPLMSLALVFQTTLATIPAAAPYVHSDRVKVAAWQGRLGPQTKPRIGLTWSGNQTAGTNRLRHFPLASLVPYLPENAQYYCLQTDITAADRDTLGQTPIIQQFDGALRDFTDTAALCECMDMVISVDTSVAHMSGALGKKTWVLLTFNADWRWLLDRDDNPWYPSMRLFRQKSQGDWAGVFARVVAELRAQL
jgi:tetratricopeptide (TPR) repeat protein